MKRGMKGWLMRTTAMKLVFDADWTSSDLPVLRLPRALLEKMQ